METYLSIRLPNVMEMAIGWRQADQAAAPLISSALSLVVLLLIWVLRNFPAPEKFTLKGIIGLILFGLWLNINFLLLNSILRETYTYIVSPPESAPLFADGPGAEAFFGTIYAGILYLILSTLVPRDLVPKVSLTLAGLGILGSILGYDVSQFFAYPLQLTFSEFGQYAGRVCTVQAAVGLIVYAARKAKGKITKPGGHLDMSE